MILFYLTSITLMVTYLFPYFYYYDDEMTCFSSLK